MALARGGTAPGSTAPGSHPVRWAHGEFGARTLMSSWKPGLDLAFLGQEPRCSWHDLGSPSPGCEVAFGPQYPRAPWHVSSELGLGPSFPSPGLALSDCPTLCPSQAEQASVSRE